MVSWLRKIQATLALASIFFFHLLGRVLFFWRKGQGLKKFLDQYVADAVYSIEPFERMSFPRFQRCQACSLCTFSCTAIQTGIAPSGFEPKYILLALARSQHESEVFLEEWLPCLECKQCVVDCPNDVPIHLVADLVVERRNRVGFRSSEKS